MPELQASIPDVALPPWRWHPDPPQRVKLIAFGEATKDCGDFCDRPLADVVKRYARCHPPGSWETHKQKWRRIKGNGADVISLKWAHWGKTCGTVQKKEISNGGIVHPDRERYINLEEARAICSFPIDFWLSDRKNGYERLGNSVPPKLMQAIAANLRQSPFLAEVEQPTVIDLFAGAGGSSLGFKWAGCRELLAVDWDNNAAETFTNNFTTPFHHGDIAKLTGNACREKAGGLLPGELHILSGSPPCQGFSSVGKRQVSDPRNQLYHEYVRLLQELQPWCFVLENVPGMLAAKMAKIYLDMCARLRECGYVVKGALMNAAYFGVPQKRERTIVIGVRQDLCDRYNLQ